MNLKFNANEIRVVTREGNPWFVAGDVCDTLGLKAAPSNGSYQNHYRRLAEDQLALAVVAGPNGKSIRVKLLSESGLYVLTMRSTKPEAKSFQDWVTKVVLPTIRKDGAYIMGEEKVVTGKVLILKAMAIMTTKVRRLTIERWPLMQELAATAKVPHSPICLWCKQ